MVIAEQNRPVSRLDWADIAKGIGIILVVMMHSTLGVQRVADATGFLDPLVAFAQPFRMPAFFLIAGFFFAPALRRSWREVIDRRVLNLVHVLLVWTLILFVAKGGVLALSSGREAALAFALAFIEPNGALWFLHALALFALVARATARLPAWLLISVAAALNLAQLNTGWTLVDEFAARFIFFIAGARLSAGIAAFAASAGAARQEAALFVTIAALANLVAVFPFLFGMTGAAVAQQPITGLLLGATGSLALVALAALIERSVAGRGLAALGRATLAIYVAFTLPMVLARALLMSKALALDVGLVSMLVTIAAIAGALAMASTARRCGAGFLYEKPRWLRLDGVRPQMKLAMPESGLREMSGTRAPSAG